MATESGKPLPELPDVPITRLSVNARAHRAKFIRWLFQNEGSVEADYKEEWSCLFEDSLESLSESVAHGGWLASAWSRKRDADGPNSAINQDSEASTGSEPVKFASLASTDILQDLRDRIKTPPSTPTAKHLVLCLSGPSRLTDEEDGGYDFVPTNIGCVFRSGHFNVSDSNASFLYGTDTWDHTFSKASNSQVVGGTFAFKGITNRNQYTQLAKLLRISICFQFSMILEQQLLLDLGLPIHFPSRPPLRHAPSSSAEAFVPKPKSSGTTPAGFLSFLQRKGAGLFRTRKQDSPVAPVSIRAGSLDASSSSPIGEPRKRRFSFMPPSSAATLPSLEAMQRSSDQFHFSENLRRIQRNREFLSTCVGVSFHPPKLLEDLAAREEEKHLQGKQIILKGDEKAGLRSLTTGKPMPLTNGTLFVSAQRISVMLSKYVWLPSANVEVSETQDSSEPVPMELKQCETYSEENLYFYARGELSLGQAIRKWVNEAEEECSVETCTFKRGSHILHYVHGGTRISVEVKVYSDVTPDLAGSEDICVWESCVCCNAAHGRKRLSDASALLSLGKFIEMLVYSPTLKKPNVRCSHGPEMRDLRRNFLFKKKVVIISVDEVGAVLEIRVPRLQIVEDEVDILVTEQRTASDCDTDGQRKTLRREIRHWCEAVADCVEDLERSLQIALDTPNMKSLPRLPSEDTPDDIDDSSSSVPTTPTAPRPRASSMLRSDSILSAFASQISHGYRGHKEESTPTAESSGMHYRESLIAISSAADSDTDPAEKVSALRTGFQQVEQGLYAQLAKARLEELNIVRRAFLLAGETVRNALIAAHPRSKDTLKSRGEVPELPFESQLQERQPDWWAKRCHVVPKGNIIIREDDWGSIIAFTMSTPEYHSELENMDHSGPLADPPTDHTPASSVPSSSGFLSLFRTAASSSVSSNREVSTYEPDGLDGFSGVVSRKEHPRDPTGILSIRDVLKAKPTSIFSDNGGTRGKTSSARSTSISSVSTTDKEKDGAAGGIRKKASNPMPPTSWGTMNTTSDAVLSLQTVTGEVSQLFSDSPEGTKDETQSKPASAVVPSDEDDNDTVKNEEEAPPAVPDKDRPISPAAPVKRPSFVSLSSGLSAAMKYMTSLPAEDTQDNVPRIVPPGQRIDDRPHIKYDWTIGKKLRFSCTVYYAKQFDLLRRRCGLFDDVFLKSLSRSANWDAEGGKSKSNFWKTADDKFIIKTLVNAWNVGDLQVLIELAPAYFQYMESTSSQATVLAKLAGFYTIEIRNLETGAVQAKADLLVMENLFCQQKIDRTFDLKGMKSRKASSSSQDDKKTKTKTLFDADWVEGQHKDLIYVQPHSKAIIEEALKRDADFLADSNIMDYSLLIGINDSNKQLSCGLVDTIGSYTFAKTLEYKAKQGLAGGTRKEVTVVPPNEYRDRFLKALNTYFVACPDKWTCFEGADVAEGGQEDLPSVF